MPNALVETWTHLWSYFADSSSYQRAYSTDYEVHHRTDEVDIYIAIK